MFKRIQKTLQRLCGSNTHRVAPAPLTGTSTGARRPRAARASPGAHKAPDTQREGVVVLVPRWLHGRLPGSESPHSVPVTPALDVAPGRHMLVIGANAGSRPSERRDDLQSSLGHRSAPARMSQAANQAQAVPAGGGAGHVNPQGGESEASTEA